MRESIQTLEYWEKLQTWGHLLIQGARVKNGARLRTEAAAHWEEVDCLSANAAEEGVLLPLPYVCGVFKLDVFQSQCLALAFLAQTSPDIRETLAALSPRCGGEMSAGMAVRLLDGPGIPSAERMQALSESGPLAAFCLRPEESGPDRPLIPVRRLLDFVLAHLWEDPNLPGLTLCHPSEDTPPRLAALAKRMDNYLALAPERRVTFCLQGLPGSGRRTLARALCRQRGMPLLLADGSRLAGKTGGAFRWAVLRESLLQGCPVCYTGLDEAIFSAGEDPEADRFLSGLLDEAAQSVGVSLMVCQEPWTAGERPAHWRELPVVLPMPDLEESRALWAGLLARYPLAQPQDPDELAGRYRLTPGRMEQAAADADSIALWRGVAGIDRSALAEGCRRQMHHALGDKAWRVETVFRWEDLILPAYSKTLLRSACDQIKHRRQVFGSWGFGEKLAYGTGLSLLFSGPPGTGKTMAAQIAAGELGLELYKVDLSRVVSKYVGETEKNLSDIFREAARSQAVLFFDEADVLFGKRTEVKDAQDKYSNMEAAYLLQKIEEYSGVSVLATNLLQNFDEAFRRRLKFIIEFPFPDARYRLALWQAVFPTKTPLSPEVDWEYLAAQFELSGSAIKNAAVNAAFLAAGDGGPVGMRQILTAVKRELAKNGKILRREDFGEYYMLVEQGECYGEF